MLVYYNFESIYFDIHHVSLENFVTSATFTLCHTLHSVSQVSYDIVPRLLDRWRYLQLLK